MLILTDTTESLRLACESCGAETLRRDPLLGKRPWVECNVCAAWERVEHPSLPPALPLSSVPALALSA